MSIAIALVLAGPGCHSLWPDDDLAGDGDLIEVQVPVGAFTGIDVTNSFIVDLRIGGADLVMTLDRNIVEAGLVVTQIEDGVVIVRQCDGCRDFAPSSGAALRFATPVVDTIRATGEVTVTAEANGEQLAIEVSGDGTVAVTATPAVAATTAIVRDDGALELAGDTPSLAVRASGDASVRSTVQAAAVDVVARDSSAVDVRASTAAHVRASGESVVTVAGEPADRTVEATDEAAVHFPAE